MAGKSSTWEESKKMWQIACPAILAGGFQFSFGFITVAFVGHLGATELAGVSVAQNVIECLAYGLLLGMGSALETLCGQAVGAGQLSMLGVYLQRSCVITLCTALLLTPLYAFASPILRLLRQSPQISAAAGRFSLWAIPQLFAFALNFPLQKFFQSQSRVWVLTGISAAVLGAHILLNWIFVIKLGHGIVGAAVVGDVSWWLVNLGQVAYLVSGSFRESWKGFSMLAFHSLGAFVKLSIASAVMICLEFWYFAAVIIMVGYLKNPETEVSAISICMNYVMLMLMITLGFTVAISVRVANELGANHPKAARFSVIVTVLTSLVIGIIFSVVVLISRKQLPRFFTDTPQVVKETSKLGYLLAATIVMSSIQPVLSGVAIGAGWQSLVAFVNIGCYYIVGLPVGAILGFKFKLNVLGIWSGMLIGSLLQAVILLVITFRTKWKKEASQAEERIKTWGGQVELQSASGKPYGIFHVLLT